MIQLNLTKNQFAVILEFLINTKLGDSNVYEQAAKDLIIEIEKYGVDDLVGDMVGPRIGVVCDQFGPTFTITAGEEDGNPAGS